MLEINEILITIVSTTFKFNIATRKMARIDDKNYY